MEDDLRGLLRVSGRRKWLDAIDNGFYGARRRRFVLTANKKQLDNVQLIKFGESY